MTDDPLGEHHLPGAVRRDAIAHLGDVAGPGGNATNRARRREFIGRAGVANPVTVFGRIAFETRPARATLSSEVVRRVGSVGQEDHDFVRGTRGTCAVARLGDIAEIVLRAARPARPLRRRRISTWRPGR